MKKTILLFLFCYISIASYAQTTYEKGYYIDNFNQKNDCLIKNIDWLNNPHNFDYKLTEHGETKTADIQSVKEFGIYNDSKYIRAKVDIDRSSNDLNFLDSDKNPLFKEETVFLKELIQGEANLYSFEDKRSKRLFYSTKDSNIEQLIYKRYKVTENSIATNSHYKQQLWNSLKCENIPQKRFNNLKYSTRAILKIFVEYNTCKNSDFINYETKQKTDFFNLNIRPRLNNSSLSIENSSADYMSSNFGNEIGFGLGLEAEFILPFNKNKWSVLVEPTYQYFKSTNTTVVPNIASENMTTEVNYKSIEIPIGLRHFFFLNSESTFFVNASFVLDFDLNSTIELERTYNSNISPLDIGFANNYAFGIGYKLKDTYSIEIRIQTKRNLLRKYSSWNSDYKTLSIILGYSLF